MDEFVSPLNWCIIWVRVKITYVSIIKHGRTTEILWFRTYVPGSTSMVTMKFFYNQVIMYWILNSIYMQFEYQHSKLSNVSVEHVQLLRGMFGSFEPREILRSFVARGIYFLKLV